MKFSKFKYFPCLALFLITGCSGYSDNHIDAEVLSVAVSNKGAVTPNPISTTAVIKSDAIEFSKIQSGQVIEKWIKKAQPTNLASLQSKISQFNLFNASDITLQPGQQACTGWQGMTIVMGISDSEHTLNVDGSVCDRTQWPEGIRELVNLHDSLVGSNTCPTFSPPSPDWCSDGTILPPVIDGNGCYRAPRCQRNISCPEYSPPAPGWCEDGTIIQPQVDQNGCYGPPTCQRNV